jgi:hypothetical protein
MIAADRAVLQPNTFYGARLAGEESKPEAPGNPARFSTVPLPGAAQPTPEGIKGEALPLARRTARCGTISQGTALIAGQLANLTRTVEEMARQLKALRERADSQQERADSQ